MGVIREPDIPDPTEAAALTAPRLLRVRRTQAGGGLGDALRETPKPEGGSLCTGTLAPLTAATANDGRIKASAGVSSLLHRSGRACPLPWLSLCDLCGCGCALSQPRQGLRYILDPRPRISREASQAAPDVGETEVIGRPHAGELLPAERRGDRGARMLAQ